MKNIGEETYYIGQTIKGIHLNILEKKVHNEEGKTNAVGNIGEKKNYI